MRFHVGRHYKCKDGNMMHILCTIGTDIYGHTMLAEFMDGTIEPVGMSAEYWEEIDDLQEWYDKINILHQR